MAKTFLFLCFVCASIAAFAASSPTDHVTISGRIIAYDYIKSLTCLNENAYWSMMIHTENSKDVRAEFIQVNFSLPCGKSPKWLYVRPSLQRFHLIRDRNADAVLEEFMGSVDESTGKKTRHDPSLPIWKHLPGTEQEKLPFGRIVPSYRSAHLPLKPVV